MSNVLHDTPPRKLHQTLTMIYPFYYLSMIIVFTKNATWIIFWDPLLEKMKRVKLSQFQLIQLEGLVVKTILFIFVRLYSHTVRCSNNVEKKKNFKKNEFLPQILIFLYPLYNFTLGLFDLTDLKV